MQNPLADELDAVHQELKKADAADPDLLEILYALARARCHRTVQATATRHSGRTKTAH